MIKPIPVSGFYNSNRFARIYLKSLEEITGRNGVNAILNYASLGSLVDNLPPDNEDRAFDFAHFSRINLALEEMYGKRGGRGMALRAGRTTFEDVLRHYGSLAGVGELAFKVMPLQKKIKAGLQAMARIFTEHSDQTSMSEEFEEHYLYRVERCPICWGREKTEGPICYYMVGLLQEGLHWVSRGKEFRVDEAKCIAQGHDTCEFIIPKNPIE